MPTFTVRQEGSNYVAQSQTRTYTGALKAIVESAVNNDLKPAGGGTVRFQAGVFDLGTDYFRLEEMTDITIEGQGIADFQRIVAAGISPALLEWKGIEATEKLAQSQNSKVVVIGSGKNGLPIILGGDGK